MSFDPIGIPQIQYGGTPFYQTTGILKPSGQAPRFVALKINWLQYFTALNSAPSIAVKFDLTGNSNFGGVLDCIKSVKIDNSNSTVAVSVWFQDTGDIIDCAPNTVVTLPAMTNGLKGLIIAQGLSAGFTPVTTVFLTNFNLPVAIDPQIQTVFPQWAGSPNIQRSNILTPGYGPPALGDQFVNVLIDANAPGSIPMFGCPRASGVVLITSCYVGLIFYSGGGNALFLESPISGTFFELFSEAGATPAAGLTLLQINGNWRLDAREAWVLRNSIAGGDPHGGYNASFSYSVQP